MWKCSQQHENRVGAKFCAKCGEQKVEEAFCSACKAKLEPSDEFCTACGHKRDAAVAVVEVPVAVPIVEPPKVEAVTAAAVPAAATPAPTARAAAEEPFRFNFGGTVIEASDDANKKPKKKAKSPMTTGLLSFLLFAVLLAAALYYLSRPVTTQSGSPEPSGTEQSTPDVPATPVP